ncbi:hypothetical protein E2986_10824 [Frieseomelitta varia]|uniref:Spondin-1 n=1 Tax=Frieseomelitta varia TaxID=561572 RepID=A0A833RSV4_9HYME|nr:hypothetical protein E2986_10824 [Frieseomelitta varia]
MTDNVHINRDWLRENFDNNSRSNQLREKERKAKRKQLASIPQRLQPITKLIEIDAATEREDEMGLFVSVTVQSDSVGVLPRRFTRFLISAEPESEDDTTESGIFDLQDETLSRYSETCPNAVMETSKVAKEEISVAWTSPSEGSGCIFIRATILETPDTWYMDDQNLGIKICQDSKAEADDQGQVLKKCCACDEAKYEDFPSKGWLIRFSDVIGASHTVDYRFWKYNGLASTGLQQLAELGSTRKLESELKNQSKKIRTIIKARGISYPNVTGKTFAVFRVDRKHHLMSLVSMIDPSPDWIVGVSGLELCLANCSWIEHKELNLYPYDAGTDDGITYLSPDSPTEPQESIRRITSSYPNDSRSPNGERKPEKGCSESEVLREWSEWTPCSTTCGPGVSTRSRSFKHKKQTKHCRSSYSKEQLQQTRDCENTECGETNSEEVSESPDRMDENDNNEDNDKKEDYEEDEPASDGVEEWSQKCIEERYMEWSLWSPCSSSCGSGTQTRFRMTHEDWHHDDVDPTECKHEAVPCQAKIATCDFTKEEAEEFCKKPKEEGRCNSNIIRWYFDKEKGCKSFKYSGCDGNENNFPTEQDCKKVCNDYQKKLKFKGIEADSQMKSSYNAEDVDCQVSEWSSWSKCAGCRGYKNSTREIKVPHRGKALQADEPRRRIYRDQRFDIEENQISVDCEITQWSKWSYCTATCGEASQHRTRIVKVQPLGPKSKLCPSLVEYRKCRTRRCP